MFTIRHFLIVICLLQLITTLERQVFDFLGYMWTPIICNFIYIIFLIICLFGVFQCRPKFVLMYTIPSLAWLAWNIFVICFYFNVGSLNRNKDLYVLNLSAGGKSWWLENGVNCKVYNNFTVVVAKSGRNPPPESSVHSCSLPYYSVELIHATIQCILAVIGSVVSSMFVYIYWHTGESLSAADAELEYVKMRHKAPARTPFDQYPYTFNQSHPVAIDNVSIDEEPPGYLDSLPAPNMDRRSLRSARSARSAVSSRSVPRPKPSSRSQVYDREPSYNYPRRDLPWVQVTPTLNFNNMGFNPHEGEFV